MDWLCSVVLLFFEAAAAPAAAAAPGWPDEVLELVAAGALAVSVVTTVVVFSVCVTVSVRGGSVTVSVRGGSVTVSVRGGSVTVSVFVGVVPPPLEVVVASVAVSGLWVEVVPVLPVRVGDVSLEPGAVGEVPLEVVPPFGVVPVEGAVPVTASDRLLIALLVPPDPQPPVNTASAKMAAATAGHAFRGRAQVDD